MTMFVPSSTAQMLSCGVDPHRVREREAVQTLADLAQNISRFGRIRTAACSWLRV